LTTKFTRCTRAASYQPRARAHASNTQFQIAPSNFMAPACSSRRKDRRTRTKASAPHNLYTPAGNNGTHKNLLRLVICPIYSVVKVRPRCPMGQAPSLQLTRLGGFWVSFNPMFGVKATFFGP